ncbi:MULTISPECIES: TRAP transporter large permease [unclassified Oceanobacter]|jgi:tripartite ATP-independent transporter DctM subunit|uniref:TRAP transporter large permease n=1 Tax=unclassified Oceanobacter TaxID=2620260 RepID=UPI0026E2BD39|nr:MULTISPECIES: TRAP transporter large permease [unclassified Oceanobacter]MDO6680726.1 TRAP transporter large permease [Oceanobacter sp. 5_MG-2023]MDP2607876.1 TRAP transporter large permease [Oceanobacter sp. 1_MG-2023]MDP2610940.1 TRAP transporter large permease [Oceanobacter sp. 2_MG-2023]
MDPLVIGLGGMVVILMLLALGCPVGLAMILVGASGFALIVGPEPALNVLETAAFETASNYSFTLIPLFLLMGSLAARAGFSKDLFESARYFTKGWNGSLALAAVSGSAAFSAISGSSLATASTMTRVAYPEMMKQGYHPRLAAGSLAAGGTLGIMIPPSVALLLYALITEQSVGDMFLAGFLPGLLAYALYLATVTVMVRKWKPSGEQAPDENSSLRKALLQFAPVGLLFGLVMGGLYGGLFSPTEAGGVGAGLALVFALVRGLGWDDFREAVTEAVAVTSTIFVILIGAEVFGFLLSVSQVSFAMVDMIDAYQLSPWMVMALIVVFYIVMGCFLESLAMILLTVPIFYPVIVASGFDPIWFGIIAVVTVETGLISPPVGMNLFVVQGATKNLKINDVMVGVIPFVLADFLRLAILIAFPAISLFLPELLGN